ncbi:DUF5693 family protein [Pelosinus propionicus]|uniref:Uncharacterized protein n=1 Tax=Pelosinus propionicus DSM 13327 TaxID=1123291 RepID=A0A1I4HVD8_9FIRM|nr:DUF5693 family protein [Pelosinus propionicus]SFL45800.1 hypothetical protein SAMN04490355_100560 [Pelosinus propionicus DSM 13327]
MREFKYNKILLLCIVIGLAAALTIVWQRHKIEESSTIIEMVMEYEDVVELAQLEGVPTDHVMQRMKEAGITSLAVYETTLEKLNKSGKVAVLSGAQLMQQYYTGMQGDVVWRNLIETGRIQAEDVYVVGRDPQVFAEVKEDLIERLSPERVTVLDSQRQILAVKANYEKVVKWNLGLPSDEMRYVSGQGFYIVARPSNYTKVEKENVEGVFDRLSGIENVSALIFVGDEALGYPDLLPLTLEKVKGKQLTLGLIEHPLQLQFFKQEGLVPMAIANDYKAARVYVIPKDEQPKLKSAEAVQRWIVTDQERNIRINLLRKYDKAEPGKTLLETNLEYVANVRDGLIASGFSIGKAGVFHPYFPNIFLLVAITVGAVAAGVLFLSLVRPFPVGYQYALFLLLSLVFAFPLLKGSGNAVRQAVALCSAVIFPVLAMTWQLDRWRKMSIEGRGSLMGIIKDGIGGLIITVMLSMVGGMYVAAVLGDVRFFLEMEIFRGVKVTFVAPLLLITIIYLARYNLFENEVEDEKDIWSQVVKLLNYPLYIKTLLIAALVAVGAWVFIGRSGHTAGVPVLDIELKMRAFLERAMYARPRGKEFMIGHPAFFLAVMALYRKWPRVVHYAMIVVATIAQGSLVETFAHLRTPVLMSFVRGIDGMVAGIGVGIVAVLAVQVLCYLSVVLGRRPVKNE